MKILLDAGHGAGRTHNRGSVCSNEGDNNFRYSLVLKRELEKIKGVSVDLVRKKITDNPGLSTRSTMGNGYDLFLSLHSNAAGASVRGTEIWDNVARPNKSLADKLVAGISKAFGHSNRGTKYRRNSSGGNYYGVLRNNNAKSSMIIEHGFHTNKTDCNFFKNNHTQIARVTADIIKSHYNLQDKEVNTNLRYGQSGKEVIQLQKDLKKLGYNVTVGGGFGEEVYNNVKRFQSRHIGVKRSGEVDEVTKQMIANDLKAVELYKKNVC